MPLLTDNTEHRIGVTQVFFDTLSSLYSLGQHHPGNTAFGGHLHSMKEATRNRTMNPSGHTILSGLLKLTSSLNTHTTCKEIVN